MEIHRKGPAKTPGGIFGEKCKNHLFYTIWVWLIFIDFNARTSGLKLVLRKKRKYIPFHEIATQLSSVSALLESIPAFHALTGSDTTSFVSGHSKKSARKIFKKHSELLRNLGEGELSEPTVRDAERFFLQIV